MNLRLAHLALLASTMPAAADDFTVYSPHVIATQSEVELRGSSDASELSVAHAFTDWWKPELYVAKYQDAAGTRAGLQGYEFENTFQLTQPGRYSADFGLIASYERNTTAGTPDAVEFGPLVEATCGRYAHVVNVIWERRVGSGSDGHTELRYSYSGTYAINKALRPGVEFYGRTGDHSYQAGPVIAGEWHLPATTGNLEYRVGVVVGLNAEAPRQTWLMRMEYEFY